MRPPKRRHSEPRNTHMPSFSLETPVWVQPCSPGLGSWTETAMSLTGDHLLRGCGFVFVVLVVIVMILVAAGIRIDRGLEAQAVDPDEQHERADGREAEVEDDAVADERQCG